MRHRIKPLLTTLAVTAAVAGGGAAIASAATSSSAAKTPSTATGKATPTAPPARGKMPGGHCPNMGSSSSHTTSGQV
ncbi:MAG: hypothetical protein ABSG43_09940 [Solirubrobacteraceae bacterium]